MPLSQRPQFVYLYDGTFAGFLTCVFESYATDEEPACFSLFTDPRTSLWPERAVETDREKAERVEPALVLVASVMVGIILLAVMLPLLRVMSALG